MKTNIRILAAVAGILVAVLIVWVALDGNNSTSDAASPGEAGTEIVSVDSLREAADEGETPIYWAGPPDGAELELSRPAVDRTYVRYLTGGAKVEDPRPFLTVGSYRLANPVATLRRLGSRPDGVLATAPGHGTVYFSHSDPQSVYLAYPGVDVEIEVFAPDFKQALQLVTSGRIVPVR